MNIPDKLATIMLLESKCSKGQKSMSKGQKSNVREAPTGQSWDNMNKK